MQALNPQRTSGFSGCNLSVFRVITVEVCEGVCVLVCVPACVQEIFMHLRLTGEIGNIRNFPKISLINTTLLKCPIFQQMLQIVSCLLFYWETSVSVTYNRSLGIYFFSLFV